MSKKKSNVQKALASLAVASMLIPGEPYNNSLDSKPDNVSKKLYK